MSLKTNVKRQIYKLNRYLEIKKKNLYLQIINFPKLYKKLDLSIKKNLPNKKAMFLEICKYNI